MLGKLGLNLIGTGMVAKKALVEEPVTDDPEWTNGVGIEP
jgi:hypothetical protein